MSKKETRIDVGQGDNTGKKKAAFIDKSELHDAEHADLADGEHVEGMNEEELEGEEEEMTEEEVFVPAMTVEEFFESHLTGEVDLAFTEHLEYESSSECYPSSYYTLSGKERLLLLYAENFRRQFRSKYPDRRPLVLVLKNECEVQKLVCTTIRPTAFLHTELIGSLEGCATFVADFIEYEQLENPFTLPPSLMSPATLVRRRRGNIFEMATLLCSMLIGAGFPAMVVSGSARLETTNNDQRNFEYPLPVDTPIDDDKDEDSENVTVNDKYKLKPKPILVSTLTEKLEALRIEREKQEKAEEERIARHEREAFEEEIAFHDPHPRTHAWIVIVHNAPWSTKPRLKILDEDGEEIDAPPTASFIEPTTGFIHDTFTYAYIHIESVWNNLNYYANLQTGRIHEMSWDLRDTSKWEHFLTAEPPEMRVIEEVSDENLLEGKTETMSIEKHLDMGQSWAEKIEIGEKEFDQKFSKLYKAFYYKRVLHKRYSPYSQKDGKTGQMTSYSDDKYEVPVMRWTWYESRTDLMSKMKTNFLTGQSEESFLTGRPDSLKFFIYNVDEKLPKIMYFYSTPRPDSLRYVSIDEQKLIMEYEKISGKCYYKKFVTKAGSAMTKIKEMTEKFQRNPAKPANKDIATTHYYVTQNKFFVQFHYLHGALTAVTREYIRPPKPDYGTEIIFSPDLTKGTMYGGAVPEATELEQYLLLLYVLKAEENAKKSFYKHLDEINGILEVLKAEKKETILKFKSSDPLRNAAARKIRVEVAEKEATELKERWQNLPDFLAPYLVQYHGRPLTHKESWDAYNSCLDDLKTRFVSLLNELQRRYEDLTAEAQSLKKFLNKFQNKFDEFDYERLLQESKDLELNKRMVQQRLTITHDEAQKKYDLVKQSLLKDPRLNLKSLSD